MFTTGVLSSIYASMLVPSDYAQAALMSSGIINGIAIYLKSYSLTMVSSKLVGTIAAQLIFIPAAYYVAWFAEWINKRGRCAAEPRSYHIAGGIPAE
ncbi:lipid II flippase Amj family protein [Mesobacillus sp. AQ2]|uniref:lipid II flippase Amj family protein n=1 Tax=Mesobacillus sp. AQ2 TaxID=3043332 RepID=UPI0021B65603|nr:MULTISPECIES: lipid II flippase Amj family protein [Bacillaceae]WHX39764.1 lipid II flippase Amj family protein [Mesobacillus sp. AQ2]